MGICMDGACAESSCGDGVPDFGNGEDCDDGNSVAGDGCEGECSFTCATDADCTDGDNCDGTDICHPITHVCIVEPPLTCDDANACTVDSCAANMCSHAPLDADGDGVFPEAGGCGGDCADHNGAVFPGASGFATDPYCTEASCPPGVLSFDYNCDGVEEAELLTLAGTCTVLPDASCSGDGWILRVPGCGELGDQRQCTPNAGRCEASVLSSVPQRCR